MQHRNRALELRLHGRAARSREIHLAELAPACRRIVFVGEERLSEESGDDRAKKSTLFIDVSPS